MRCFISWHVVRNGKEINMKQFLSFVQKEFYHVFRDGKTLILLFGLPVIMILLFGFALTNEIKHSKIVVCDYAQDEASTQITRLLTAGHHFELVRILKSPEEIEAAFRSGSIKLAIVFPANFQYQLLHTNMAQIQVIADASDPNTATTLTGYVQNSVADYQRSVMKTNTVPYQIIPEIRMLYNPELKGATNFVPGVMALVLLLVCVLMTSVSIVREKEKGTMEVLLVSPFNPLLVILSKAVPYFMLSLVNLTVILIMGVFALGMPFNGSLLLLYAVSAVFIITALSLGLLISNATGSQQTAMLISLMGMLIPTLLFTGFMFPIENMPLPLQIISNVLPSKWYYIMIKSIMIKGLGFSAIWKETVILISMTAILLGLSLKKFNIRLI